MKRTERTSSQVTRRVELLLERAEDVEDVSWLKRTRHRLVSYGSLEEYLTNHKHK